MITEILEYLKTMIYHTYIYTSPTSERTNEIIQLETVISFL